MIKFLKGEIHGWTTFFRVVGDKVYYPEKSKGKYIWQLTHVTPERLTKFKEIEVTTAEDAYEDANKG